jgi:UDP-N-acetylglucosamine--N-acetylmuramyl-(pentapeptide) pyrophosphoryl-undecaprenol N-acetylglucosamine transferase
MNMTGVVLKQFITEMQKAYAAADIIVSRAGAIAVSELCIIGKPLILIPSPNVAEDHQTKNAMALVNDSAAILIKDKDSREKLVPEILDLISNEEKQKSLSNNIKKKGILNADELIVDAIKQISK